MDGKKNDRMNRINAILQHEDYQKYLKMNTMAEADRRFCHHDMEHFLAVARLAMILRTKEQLEIEDELIYAVALLHDIGRWKQYQDGTGHEIASYELAPEILDAAGFCQEERETVLSAILQHRNPDKAQEASLEGLIYRADKMSRSCFACEMEKECNWKNEKKNLQLQY